MPPSIAPTASSLGSPTALRPGPHLKVADVAVTDDALGTNTLSLAGADASFFELIGTELFLKAGTALNFEAKSSYQVAVTVDDATIPGSPDGSSNYSLSITNVNEVPSAVTLLNKKIAIAENTATTTHVKVADIAVTDDALGAKVLGLTGADAAKFEIVGTQLFLKAGTALDFETKTSYAVAVTVDDPALGGGVDATSTLYTLAVSNVTPERINGTAVTDVLKGGSDIDLILGLAGNDQLFGFGNHDVLTGGLGRDVMTGGAGRDIFDFNSVLETGKTAALRDVITDFVHVTDRIDLSTIDANGVLAGNGVFKFLAVKGAAFTKVAGQLHWSQIDAPLAANDKTIIEGAVNGDGAGDFQIELRGLVNLTAADFIL